MSEQKKPAPPVQPIDKEQQKRIVALEAELEKVKALAAKLVTLLNEGQTELVALRAEVVGLSQDLAEVQVNGGGEVGYVNAGLDVMQTTDYDGEVYAPGTPVKVNGAVGFIVSEGIADGDSRNNVGYNVLTVPTVGPLRTVFALRTELVRC